MIIGLSHALIGICITKSLKANFIAFHKSVYRKLFMIGSLLFISNFGTGAYFVFFFKEYRDWGEEESEKFVFYMFMAVNSTIIPGILGLSALIFGYIRKHENDDTDDWNSYLHTYSMDESEISKSFNNSDMFGSFDPLIRFEKFSMRNGYANSKKPSNIQESPEFG